MPVDRYCVQTGSHCEMKLRLCHQVDVWADKTSGFSLANKRGGSSYNRLCAGDIHRLEEEPRALTDQVSYVTYSRMEASTYKPLMSHCITPR